MPNRNLRSGRASVVGTWRRRGKHSSCLCAPLPCLGKGEPRRLALERKDKPHPLQAPPPFPAALRRLRGRGSVPGRDLEAFFGLSGEAGAGSQGRGGRAENWRRTGAVRLSEMKARHARWRCQNQSSVSPVAQSCPPQSVQSLSRVRLFATPWTAARQASLSITDPLSLLVGDAIQPSHPLSSPSSPAFSLSQHQGLFQ